MIEIDGKIVSTEILTEHFLCDLSRCRGICCVEGNAGAPLDPGEAEELEAAYHAYEPWLKPEGVAAIREQGFVVVDGDGDHVTPLIGGAECAYSFEEGGVTYCAVERAFREGKTTVNKPISCHLYPIRVIRFGNGTIGLNYHRWSVCAPAIECGKRRGIPLYVALKDPIIRAFGKEFFDALRLASQVVANR